MEAQRRTGIGRTGTDVDEISASRHQRQVHLRRTTFQRQRHFSKMSAALSTTKSTLRGTHPGTEDPGQIAEARYPGCDGLNDSEETEQVAIQAHGAWHLQPADPERDSARSDCIFNGESRGGALVQGTSVGREREIVLTRAFPGSRETPGGAPTPRCPQPAQVGLAARED